MTRLLIATRSLGKQAEFRELLSSLPLEIIFPSDVGLVESPEEADLELFDTFEENARSKARWFATQSGLAALADDSGLEVDALGGAPGVHSKRFAGLAGPDELVTEANNAHLLARLAGGAGTRRTARYRCVLVLVRGRGQRELVASGSTEGVILESPRGANGFGYDPLFFSRDLGRSFGEASAEEKHRVSHRARAVSALIELLRGGRV